MIQSIPVTKQSVYCSGRRGGSSPAAAKVQIAVASPGLDALVRACHPRMHYDVSIGEEETEMSAEGRAGGNGNEEGEETRKGELNALQLQYALGRNVAGCASFLFHSAFLHYSSAKRLAAVLERFMDVSICSPIAHMPMSAS